MLCHYFELTPQARVWIYPSDKEFSPFVNVEIKTLLRYFLEEWTAHNQALLTYGDIYHNRFIVIFVDESQVGASGCSIDKSTHFIESLESRYGLNLLDRQNVAYLDTDDTIIDTKLSELPQLYAQNLINDDTLVFNHLVKSKDEWEKKWKAPLKESWHKRFT